MAKPLALKAQEFPQDRSLLITLGKDEATTNLKVWNPDSWSKSGRGPVLLRTVECFDGKHSEAEVTQLAISEGSWPKLTYALGLSNGHVSVLQADTGERPGLPTSSWPGFALQSVLSPAVEA